MLNEENRLDVQKLFILGAGASFDASKGKDETVFTKAPLDKDFCSRFLDLPSKYKRPKWMGSSVDFVKNKFKDFRPISEFGLEQAILRQLGHLEFINQIYKMRGRKDNFTEIEYLNHIAHLICFVFGKTKNKENSIYKVFANKVFPKELSINNLDKTIKSDKLINNVIRKSKTT